MTTTHALRRWVIPTILFALTACDSDTSTGVELGDVTFAITALTCQEEGINTTPFTVADAMAANAAAHDVASDYSYDAGSATAIAFDGTAIAVTGAGASASGSVVTVTAPGTYLLSGTLTDGQVVVDSPSDGVVKLVLNGVSITSASNSGIQVNEADRTVIILAAGTSNSVTDGASYPDVAEQNAAVWSDDDLSIGGTGALVVTARFEDGIASKDGLVIASGVVTITAPDEGIRGRTIW
jgi:hypothetical protein